MAFKNEKHTYLYSIEKDKSDMFYTIVRDYVSMDDITRLKNDERVTYKVSVKIKNLGKFTRDIKVMQICGLDIKAERS